MNKLTFAFEIYGSLSTEYKEFIQNITKSYKVNFLKSLQNNKIWKVKYFKNIFWLNISDVRLNLCNGKLN